MTVSACQTGTGSADWTPAFDPGDGSSWPLWLPWTIESILVAGLLAITLTAAAKAAAKWVKRRRGTRR